MNHLLTDLEHVQQRVKALEPVIAHRCRASKEAVLISSVPGVSYFAASSLACRVGRVERPTRDLSCDKATQIEQPGRSWSFEPLPYILPQRTQVDESRCAGSLDRFASHRLQTPKHRRTFAAPLTIHPWNSSSTRPPTHSSRATARASPTGGHRLLPDASARFSHRDLVVAGIQKAASFRDLLCTDEFFISIIIVRAAYFKETIVTRSKLVTQALLGQEFLRSLEGMRPFWSCTLNPRFDSSDRPRSVARPSRAGRGKQNGTRSELIARPAGRYLPDFTCQPLTARRIANLPNEQFLRRLAEQHLRLRNMS
jgi:hypothetical protein